MTEPLPITIHICDDLKQQFIKITAACNKLEAQFNFQTMSANWYGDEDNILFVQLHLATPQGFAEQQKFMQQNKIKTYSDDVFSYVEKSKKSQALRCYIAITATELALLNQQDKLLAGLLQVKLRKVLNLIAKQVKLTAI
ncbi:MAG: hypothetical protein JKY81_09370 [Colwellia sp.]|nr:hypothetical protein [Colwellia sp.]